MDLRVRAAAIVSILFSAVSSSPGLGAQEASPQPPSHYRVIDLGTLGGTVSSGNTINNLGWVMGSSNEAGDTVQLATLWLPGQQIPLGTLGGPSSNVLWPVKNNSGLISGVTENGSTDPDVSNGSLAFLPEAFLWTREGGIQGLHTLPGDAISEATDINDAGQVVGVSYGGTDFSNPRAFIYQNGVMTPLNQLLSKSDQAGFYISSTGGINDLGEIAAQANLVSNGVVTTTLHAVLLVPGGDREDGAVEAQGVAQKLVISESAQAQMRQHAGMRHFGPVRPGAARAQ